MRWFWIAGFCGIVVATSAFAQSAEPATKPSDQKLTEPADPLVDPDKAVIRLPDGREVNLADLQRDGTAGVFVMRSVGGGMDGTTVQVVDEQGRRVKIQSDDDGIVVTIKDGDAEPVEYRAANAEELEERHPEAFELYDRYGRPDMIPLHGAVGGGGMRNERIAVRLGEPGAPMGMRMAVDVETLGATCAAVSDEFVKTQLGGGVIVVRVGEESFAHTLGLQRHDLIKSVNGKPVDSPRQLDEALVEAERVELEIVRKGQALTLSEK